MSDKPQFVAQSDKLKHVGHQNCIDTKTRSGFEIHQTSQYNSIALCRLFNNLPDPSGKGVHSWLFV